MATTAELVPPHMMALATANAVRLAGAAVKREVRRGHLTVTQALSDPRSDCLEIMALLMAQPRWGVERAGRLLRVELIPETKRVRDLTARQRRVLAETCDA